MIISQLDLEKYDRAEWCHECIEQEINELYVNLKDDEKLAVNVVLQGGTLVSAIWFGYRNPNLIIVEGHDIEGRTVRLLIPQNQIQLMMTVIKEVPESDYPKIGFQARFTDLDA